MRKSKYINLQRQNRLMKLQPVHLLVIFVFMLACQQTNDKKEQNLPQQDTIIAENDLQPARFNEANYGNYVSEDYNKRNEGYDWIGVSVEKMNEHRVKISVRSRADKKRPTCTFDANATVVDTHTLKVYQNDVGILFRFTENTVSIQTEKEENQDRLSFYCSGGGSLAGNYSKIDEKLDAEQIDKTAYTKSLMWDDYLFFVEVQNDTLSIRPVGLEIDNQPVTHKIDGTVINAEIGDLNNDTYPEVLVYIASGSNKYGSVIGYSVNNGKSMSQMYIPKVSKASEGYAGHDEFSIVESTLVQRFPIYEAGAANPKPTGKTRQFQYKLKEGEAMRQLTVDKVMEY